MTNLKKIIERCDVLLAAANMSNDKKRIEQLNEIKKFLSDNNCFVNTDKIKCTYYLLRLGYDFDEADEIYDEFNKVQEFFGVLEYIDSNGKLFMQHAILKPNVEDYFMFDNGIIFKFDNKKNKFYLLLDGEWVYDGSLQRKFYSSEYSYVRLKYKIDEKKNSNKR